MMAKRHGSRGSAGAALPAGCGGLFVLLILVGLVVKYWWVLALVIGVVMIVRAIWATKRRARPYPDRSMPRIAGAGELGLPTPARKLPAKAPKPKKSLPLSGDALTAQLRSDKRRRRRQSMEEWDGEWERLLGFGSVRQPVESKRSKRREAVSEPTSIDIGIRVVVINRIPANPANPAQAELGDTGTVTQVGAPSSVPGLRRTMVRLDRTGQVITIIEKSLAPLSKPI